MPTKTKQPTNPPVQVTTVVKVTTGDGRKC